MPSLNPCRLRGVVWPFEVDRRAAEAELRPAQRGPAAPDAGEVADRVERDHRVVGARLDAEVAAGPGRLEGVAGEARQLDAARCGRRAASPKRSSKSDGPKPKVTVSRAAGSPSASPVSDRRRSEVVVDVADRLPAVMRAAAAVQSRSRAASSPTALELQVERAEDEPVLSGRRDAGLVLAVERDGLPGVPSSRSPSR